MFRKSKYVVSLIVMIMSVIQVSGCNGNDNITSVPATEFENIIKGDSVHIAGALNINVQSDDFQQVAEKELSKDSTILVYCRSGRRSMNAAEILTKLGYKVVNLKGGIIEWREDGLPVTNVGLPK